MNADPAQMAADNPLIAVLSWGAHCHEAIRVSIGGNRRGIGVHRRLH
jgi:hypothetical protein